MVVLNFMLLLFSFERLFRGRVLLKSLWVLTVEKEGRRTQ